MITLSEALRRPGEVRWIGCGDVVAPRRGRVGWPRAHRGPRAPRTARVRLRGQPVERASRHPGVLAATVVVPRPQHRRGHDPVVEPLRDDGVSLRGRSAERMALRAADAAVLAARARDRDEDDDHAAAAARRSRALRVPTDRGSRARRRHGRGSRDRRRDGRERDRDRDAVRRRSRVGHGHAARCVGVPARRTVVTSHRLAGADGVRVVPGRRRASVPRAGPRHRAADRVRGGADGARGMATLAAAAGGAPGAVDRGAAPTFPVPLGLEPERRVRRARRGLALR